MVSALVYSGPPVRDSLSVGHRSLLKGGTPFHDASFACLHARQEPSAQRADRLSADGVRISVAVGPGELFTARSLAQYLWFVGLALGAQLDRLVRRHDER